MIKEAFRDGLLWDLWQRWLGFKESRNYARGKLDHLPQSLKAQVVVGFARAYALHSFVETGTWIGLMIGAVQGEFNRVYSVELHQGLAERARKRFRTQPHIRIYQGNSADVLPAILAELKEPGLFWLDAHYSGATTARGQSVTPVLRELELILGVPGNSHVILVDDAREFGSAEGYPTLEEVHRWVGICRPGAGWEVKDDIIRITPPGQATGASVL